MSEEDFEKLVEQALKEMPEEILKQMENVAIVVEKRPTPEQLGKTGIRYGSLLLGLYQGVPKTKWGRGFGNILPDKITIFQDPIETLACSRQRRGSPEAAEDKIPEILKNTIFHEIAHHFGFDEKSIRELENKRKSRK